MMSFVQKCAFASIALSLTACETSQLGVIMPNFTLVDTNPNSETFETEIMPRNYLGAVTGWYFGHGD